MATPGHRGGGHRNPKTLSNERGGDVEGIILNDNKSLPKQYWFGFQQRRLTWKWFAYGNPSQDEQDQIFNAAVWRKVRLEMALAMAQNANITTLKNEE